VSGPQAAAGPSPTAHLTPAVWAGATRHLMGKALAEFSHERLLHPVPETRDGPGGRRYAVTGDDESTTYRFVARRLALDHWQIDEDSVTRWRAGAELPLDAAAFVTEFRDALAFWRTVAECVSGYQRAHPRFADALARYDLFAPRFARSGLNRLQLRDNRQMVDLADPSAALQFAGTLDNPLAAHGPR
jgi:siderophore synthetase component